MIVECPRCRLRYDVSGRPAGTQAHCRCGATFVLPKPPETARGLACPQCGALTAAQASACAYCRSPLAVVVCPRCFGRVFASSKHCDHCGAEVHQGAWLVADGEPTPRQCPCCVNGEATLVAHMAADTLLDECARCGGVWLDRAALERILADRKHASVAAALGLPADLPAAVGAAVPVVYRRCPDCHIVMNRVNFGKHSGVIVDVCRLHGTWFDRNELSRVIEFVSSGGLDASRVADFEAQRRELERARSRLDREAFGIGWESGGHWGDSLISAIRSVFDRLS